MKLEDIVISRVRVKILTLFMTHPGQMFHVREIVRRTEEEINAVRRELAHMEKKGMVSKERPFLLHNTHLLMSSSYVAHR